MGTTHDLHNCRLKSARRRKRLQKQNREKRLIQLYKEERKLSKQISNLGYEPLIPPIQRGWKRTFVLREDVRESERAEFFLELLKKINTTQYSDRKDFTKKGRKKGRKVRILRGQKLKFFYEYELAKVKLSEAEALLFKETFVFLKNRKTRRIYEFIEPWRYVLKVMPNMITQVRITDNILEQKRDEINDYLTSNNLYPKIFKLLKGHYQYNGWNKNDEKPKYKSILKNNPIHLLTIDFKNNY